MSNLWQLFVNGLEGKTKIIEVHKDASVDELMKKISDQNGIQVEDQRILFGGKQLQYGAGKYLKDYHLENNSNLFIVLRLKGGIDNKELDDLVELSDAPDMITWDDDKDSKRAKMPCGHAIGPESLTAYCHSLLTAGKFQFHCPYINHSNPEATKYCRKEWEYFIVRRLAVLSDKEKEVFEKKLSQNYLRKSCGIQECPRCKSMCERKDRTQRRLVCPLCTHKLKYDYEFCWYCLHEWKDKKNSFQCGNESCANEDPRLGILRSCPKKVIVGVKDCPSRRACVHCGLLIEHQEACKHMVCSCGTKFCFICLKGADTKGEYQCGTFNSPCVPSPIQTTVPGA